jgi:hypothetical protein
MGGSGVAQAQQAGTKRTELQHPGEEIVYVLEAGVSGPRKAAGDTEKGKPLVVITR